MVNIAAKILRETRKDLRFGGKLKIEVGSFVCLSLFERINSTWRTLEPSCLSGVGMRRIFRLSGASENLSSVGRIWRETGSFLLQRPQQQQQTTSMRIDDDGDHRHRHAKWQSFHVCSDATPSTCTHYLAIASRYLYPKHASFHCINYLNSPPFPPSDSNPLEGEGA